MAILKGIISKLNGSAGNLTFKQLGGPEALRAVQVEPWLCSNSPAGGPLAEGRSRGAKEQAKPAAGQKPCGVVS